MRTAPGTIGRNKPTIPPSTRIHPRAKRAARRSFICTCAVSVSCVSNLLKRSTNRFLAVASTSAASIEGNVTGGYPCEKVFRDSNLAISGATPACRTTKSKNATGVRRRPSDIKPGLFLVLGHVLQPSLGLLIALDHSACLERLSTPYEQND